MPIWAITGGRLNTTNARSNSAANWNCVAARRWCWPAADPVLQVPQCAHIRAPIHPPRRPRVPDRRPCRGRCTFHSQAGPPGTGALRRQTTTRCLTSSQATRRAPCVPGSGRELGRCPRFVPAALDLGLPRYHSTENGRGTLGTQARHLCPGSDRPLPQSPNHWRIWTWSLHHAPVSAPG